jgi:hypothetical protein
VLHTAETGPGSSRKCFIALFGAKLEDIRELRNTAALYGRIVRRGTGKSTGDRIIAQPEDITVDITYEWLLPLRQADEGNA